MVPTQVEKFRKLQGVVLGRQVVPGMEILGGGGGGESKSAIWGGGGSSKAKVPFVGRIWIFSGSTHSTHQEALRILCVEKREPSSVHVIIFSFI